MDISDLHTFTRWTVLTFIPLWYLIFHRKLVPVCGFSWEQLFWYHWGRALITHTLVFHLCDIWLNIKRDTEEMQKTKTHAHSAAAKMCIKYTVKIHTGARNKISNQIWDKETNLDGNESKFASKWYPWVAVTNGGVFPEWFHSVSAPRGKVMAHGRTHQEAAGIHIRHLRFAAVAGHNCRS